MYVQQKVCIVIFKFSSKFSYFKIEIKWLFYAQFFIVKSYLIELVMLWCFIFIDQNHHKKISLTCATESQSVEFISSSNDQCYDIFEATQSIPQFYSPFACSGLSSESSVLNIPAIIVAVIIKIRLKKLFSNEINEVSIILKVGNRFEKP